MVDQLRPPQALEPLDGNHVREDTDGTGLTQEPLLEGVNVLVRHRHAGIVEDASHAVCAGRFIGSRFGDTHERLHDSPAQAVERVSLFVSILQAVSKRVGTLLGRINVLARAASKAFAPFPQPKGPGRRNRATASLSGLCSKRAVGVLS